MESFRERISVADGFRKALMAFICRVGLDVVGIGRYMPRV